MAESKWSVRGQKWTFMKNQFLLMLWAKTRLNLRVLVAWMAVESGGSGNKPSGADFNFLQVKGTGQAGTSNGFKKYRNVYDAARDAIANIKARPEIGASVGKGPIAQMRAISRAWARGAGNAAALDEVSGYYNKMLDAYHRVDEKALREGWQLDDPERIQAQIAAGKSAADTYGRPPKPGIADQVTGAITGAFGNIAEALWPVLLKTALAGTGLALIGYGLKGLFGSSTADTTTKVVPVATGVAKEVA